jgi:hypothetical protein
MITKRLAALIFGLVIVLTGSSVLWAHHGTSAFDATRTIVVKGTVTDFEFIQPHALITFDAKNENGDIEKWFVELTTPNYLVRYGWNRKTLKPGDQITITGNPPKNGAKTLHPLKIVSSNGQEIPLASPAENRY